MRRLAHRLVTDAHSAIQFSADSRRFVETVEASAALKARARAIRDELAQVVAESLARSVGRDPDDPIAYQAAGLVLATWTAAFVLAHRSFRWDGDAETAKAAFLAIIDRGTLGLQAAMAGTPYA